MVREVGWTEYAVDATGRTIQLKFAGSVGTRVTEAEVDLRGGRVQIKLVGCDRAVPGDTAVNAGLEFGWVALDLPEPLGDRLPTHADVAAPKPARSLGWPAAARKIPVRIVGEPS